MAGDVDRPVEKDCQFRLEPEWVAVVMVALIYSGDIEVTYGSKKVNASNIRELATMSLADLEDQLDQMLANWQGAVVSALGSDMAQRSLAAMTPEEKQVIQAFLDHPDAPVLPTGFIEAANKALQGIESLAVSLADLEEALREWGLPRTVDEFKARFARFMLKTMRGRDEANTRLTVEE